MKAFRLIVGGLVRLVSWLTMPKAGQRSEAHQAQVEQQIANYSLYQFAGCPFCIKVRRAMRRLNLPLELRDAGQGSPHRQELLEQGGRVKAPCLRIDKADGSSVWMYESNDIIAYLSREFPLQQSDSSQDCSTAVRVDA
ncbi:MAG: glutathione S-transferase N-terminal domain-containing protein [Halopseudomonas sp.]